jgi:uncharacterized protein (TIGR00251 family)
MKDIMLKVYLQPKSSKNEIVGAYRDGIKVKVTAPPVEGKANEALIRFLAKELKVSPSCIEILKGHHSREKTLRISDLNALPVRLRSSLPLQGRDKGASRSDPEQRPALGRKEPKG